MNNFGLSRRLTVNPQHAPRRISVMNQIRVDIESTLSRVAIFQILALLPRVMS